MSKLTKQITAMLLVGMLVIGLAPGSVLAASTDVDLGQTSETAQEMLTEEISEIPASVEETSEIAQEVYEEETSEAPADAGETSQVEDTSEELAAVGETAEEASAEEETAAQYYTVTLDANGGYFENEWDDVIGDYTQQAEVVEKHIPVDGTVAAFPVFIDQDGHAMLFAGWSLDPGEEAITVGDEDYAPVDNCVLYAVWKPENAALGETGEQEVAEENSEQSYGPQESEAVEDLSGDTVAAEEGRVEEDAAYEAKTDAETENEQAIEFDQEVVYSDEKETVENSSDAAVAEEATHPELNESSEEEEIAKENAAKDAVESGTCGENLTWTLDEEGTLTISGTGIMKSHPWTDNYKEVITHVIIENGITSIGNCAFYGCNSVMSVAIPERVTSIGDYAFYCCERLNSVTIPESITSMGNYVFWGCSSLTSVMIPAKVECIGNYAFYHCNSLMSVTIQEGVTSIGNWAFAYCDNLTTLAIPESVSFIGEYAFQDCSLQSVKIPKGMTSIGYSAFVRCSSLKSITIPESVTSIGDHAFMYCYSLTSITIPESVTYIGEYAFMNCSGLRNVTIPKSVKSIRNHTFENCINLTSITIQEGVTFIEESVFSGCPNLADVYYVGSIDDWSAIPIGKDNVYLINATVHCDIEILNIADTSITGLTTKTYTGKAITQTPVVILGDTTLIMSMDYMITYSNNINVGTATVIITGVGKYFGTKEQTFTINKATQSLTASNLSLTFPNSGKITASGNKGMLTYRSDNTAVATVDSAGKVTTKGAGTAKITITAAETDNYIETLKTITVTVGKATQSIIVSNLSLTYPNSGKITASGNKGTLSYKTSNTAIATVDSAGKVTAKGGGKATITITAAATSNYNAATKTITVKVSKADQSITAKAGASSVAVGKTTTVSITGNKGTKSFKSSDTNIATVSSTGKVTAKKVGKVTITATSASTSNYKVASKTVTIKIVPAATASLTAANQALGIMLTWKKVTGANAYFIYRGSTQIAAIKNGSTVTYTDKKANTNGAKYTYRIIASASATGRSTLSKSVTTYFVSRPAISTLTNSAASKMTVKWGKNAKATGYQIQYCPDKTFKTGNKSVSINSASTVSKVIGNLAKGKTYYVRIRTYKTAGSTKYFSAWSAVKSVKITK